MIEFLLVLLPLGIAAWLVSPERLRTLPLRKRLLGLGIFLACIPWSLFCFWWADQRREAAITTWSATQGYEVQHQFPPESSRGRGRINWDRLYSVWYRDRQGGESRTVVQVGHWFWGYFSDAVVERKDLAEKRL